MYYQHLQNTNTIPKSYVCDVLEGNWYEDRCISRYDDDRKKNYKIKSPNNWQYDTTYKEIGGLYQKFPKLQRFGESNDNFINFQKKDYNMYITTNRYIKFITGMPMMKNIKIHLDNQLKIRISLKINLKS